MELKEIIHHIQIDPAPQYITSIEGDIIAVNQNLAYLLDFSSTEELKIQMANHLKTEEGYALEYNRSDFLNSLKDGQIRNHLARWKKKDGSPIYLLESANLFTTETDGREYFLGTVVDISEHILTKVTHEALIESVPAALVVLSSSDDVVRINDEFSKLFGYSSQEAIGKKINDLVTTKEQLAEAKMFSQRVQSGGFIQRSTRRRKKNGTLVDVLTVGKPFFLKGEQIGIIAIYQDITHQKRIEQKLKEAKEFAELLLEVAPAGIMMLDLEKRITSWNSGAERITGMTNRDVVGKSCSIFESPVCQGECGLYSINYSKPIVDVECEISTAKGKLTILKNVVQIRDDSGKIVGGMEIFYDITERKRLELEIKEQSIRDSLTDLFNRNYFDLILNQLSTRYSRSAQAVPVSALMIDLDYFKKVNDTFGHAAGDDVLIALAEVIKQLVREDDVAIRYGGEEIVVLLPETDAENALLIAGRIKQAINDVHFEFNGKAHNQKVSIGVSTLHFGGDIPVKEKSNTKPLLREQFETLIIQSDVALYSSKNSGRDRVTAYNKN